MTLANLRRGARVLVGGALVIFTALVLAKAIFFGFVPNWHVRNTLIEGSVVPKGLVDLLTLLITIVVHEFGHLVGAMVMGGRPYMTALGPLVIMRTNRGVRFGLNQYTGFLSAFAVSIPGPTKYRRLAFAMEAAGGPLANLATFFLGVSLARMLIEWPPAMTYISLKTAYWSLVLFLVNLTPVRVAGVASDGARLWEIRSHDGAQGVVAFAKIQALDLSGVRPKDWPTNEVEHVNTLILRGSNSADLCRLTVKLPTLLSQGLTEQADSEIRMLLGSTDMPSSFLRTAHLMGAYTAARQGDAAAARARLERAPKGLESQITRMCIDAAIAEAEGDRTLVESLADRLLHTETGMRGVELMWSDLLRNIVDRIGQPLQERRAEVRGHHRIRVQPKRMRRDLSHGGVAKESVH